ncbi:unknown [Fusobacterium sp. CAG:439]|nr:unknown [Fusobacterium sp. CAG:439]
MYHVYTIKNRSEFSKTLVAETKDYDLALQKAQKAVEGKEGYNYVVEETDGSMNSYGELIATVVAEG